MKRNFKFVIPLSLMIIMFLSACELPRPGGDTGNIGEVQPVIDTPAPDVTPIEPTVPPPEPPTGVAQEADDISREIFPAAVAPPAELVEEGTVLVKLTQSAAIQARSAELGSDNIVTAGIPSLDQQLRAIGASELEPVIEEVAEVVGEELESFSAQAEDMGQLYSVSFPPENNPQDVAALLEQDPTVEYAEPNYIAGITGEPRRVSAQFTPNDPYFRFQWNFQNIQMPIAWEANTGENVIVAIVDTGIDFNTPDLANTQHLQGYDFANNDPDPTDDQGHGTHVAGTVAQSTNNAVGVTGVAYNARLLPVKALGSNGQGSYENIIKGIVYAVDQGARVINMSLAGRSSSDALREAVEYAHNRGVVVVAAAGNSSGPVEYPAAYDELVVAVGATGLDNALAPYSNFGPQIDLVAPGGNVDVDLNQDSYADGVLQQTFQTPGDYKYLFFEGTSMASPHVAGLAALILSLKPSALPAEVEDIMTRSALNLGSADQFGAGLIQAGTALALALGELPGGVTPQAPTDTPTVVPGEPPTDTPTPTVVIGEPPTDTPTATVEPIGEHDEDLITPTPTPTLTPVGPPQPPAPVSPGELLTNGNFESEGGWVFGDTPIRGGYETSLAFSGARSARLGATSGRDVFSYSSVWQRVTIPAEATQVTLTAQVYPISQDVPGTDVQQIMILNENFRALRTLARGLSNSQTWEARSYDLSDLRGRTIYVYFSVVNQGRTSGLSAMYVDDVSLTWSR